MCRRDAARAASNRSRGRLPREKDVAKVVASLALIALLQSAGVAAITSPVAIANVRGLPPEEARAERAVSVRGVVTFVNEETGELFVQDRSAGIFVFIRNSHSARPIHAGQLVKVDGVTAAGDFLTSINRARIEVLGAAPMPKPLVLPLSQIMTGEQDSQWGRLTGVIRSGREERGLLYLNAAARGGVFLVILKDYPADWARTLVDSKVALEGVIAALFNQHRQATGIRLFVPGMKYVTMVERAPGSAFDLPLSTPQSVGSFRPDRDWDRRIHLRATVTATAADELLYVTDGEVTLPVELRTPCESKPGSVIDVVGFPGIVENRPALQNATCRALGIQNPEHSVQLRVADVLPAAIASDGSGLSFAKATRYDLQLVTLAGTVVQTSRGALRSLVTLVSGDQMYTATIPDAAGVTKFDNIGTGARVRITGVCLITFDEYHRAESFRLLVRGNSDIEILSRAPWLTLRHALWIILPLFLSVLAAAVWIGVLRRHVASKTRELCAANDRLRQLTGEDALTGAANRRHFDEALREEMLRSRHSQTPLSLAIIDLDNFKQVNDLYGHQRGDQSLIQVVGALRRALLELPNTVVARYGGEEFAVLIPGMPPGDALVYAEKMRQSVYDMAIAHARSPFDQRQTVSIGVAGLSGFVPSSEYEELISRADHALYEAKRSGRNRVSVYNAKTESQSAVSLLPFLQRS